MQSLGTSWYIVTCPMAANDAKDILQKCRCQVTTVHHHGVSITTHLS